MYRKKICYMLLICFLLTSCDTSLEEHAIVKNSTQVEATTVPTIEPDVKSVEQPEDSQVDEIPRVTYAPRKGIYVEKSDPVIEGRHYTYMKYKINNEEGTIRLISLKTREDSLVIPKQIDNCDVVCVGGERAEVNGEGVGYEYEDVHGMLCWQNSYGQKLQKIIIPEGVKSIYPEGFRGVYAKKVVCPQSLKKIGNCAFTAARIENVVVKRKNTRLKWNAFSGSTLKKINLPKGFKGIIESNCFEETNLISFDWPDYGKEVLNSEEWPYQGTGNETKIGFEVFKNCKNLKNINFSANQDHIYIPNGTFLGCVSLEKLEFPASTKKVTYRDCAYVDSRKNGVQTLIFRGKDTELVGDVYKGEGNYNYITVGKIVGPKDSKSIQFAKKALKIASCIDNETWECIQMGDVQDNYSGNNGWTVKLVSVEYQEIE